MGGTDYQYLLDKHLDYKPEDNIDPRELEDSNNNRKNKKTDNPKKNSNEDEIKPPF